MPGGAAAGAFVETGKVQRLGVAVPLLDAVASGVVLEGDPAPGRYQLVVSRQIGTGVRDRHPRPLDLIANRVVGKHGRSRGDHRVRLQRVVAVAADVGLGVDVAVVGVLHCEQTICRLRLGRHAHQSVELVIAQRLRAAEHVVVAQDRVPPVVVLVGRALQGLVALAGEQLGDDPLARVAHHPSHDAVAKLALAQVPGAVDVEQAPIVADTDWDDEAEGTHSRQAAARLVLVAHLERAAGRRHGRVDEVASRPTSS